MLLVYPMGPIRLYEWLDSSIRFIRFHYTKISVLHPDTFPPCAGPRFFVRETSCSGRKRCTLATLYHLLGEAGVLQDEAIEKDFGVPDEKWKMGSSKNIIKVYADLIIIEK